MRWATRERYRRAGEACETPVALAPPARERVPPGAQVTRRPRWSLLWLATQMWANGRGVTHGGGALSLASLTDESARQVDRVRVGCSSPH